MSAAQINDPLEQVVAIALEEAGIAFLHEGETGNEARLDFYLPKLDTYIEVKQFHSDRIAGQMARAPNVIVLQGRRAVVAFCAMLKL